MLTDEITASLPPGNCPVCIFASTLNPLNADLNPICHLLALLRAHHILHISRVRANAKFIVTPMPNVL